MTSTIQIRIDSKVKKEAQTVFENLGLDLSSGVKLYLTQVVREQGLPFTPRTVNGFIPEQEARILRETAWAKKNGKRYRSAKEALKDILG